MIEFLFPKKDTNNSELGNYLSNKIKKEFEVYNSVCYKCYKETKEFNTHYYCKSKFDLEKVIVCFRYTNKLKKYIINFKYFHKKDMKNEIGLIMNMFYEINFSHLKKEETCITFVPIHRIKKYFVKGYNQGELLAQIVSEKQKISCQKVLKK